MTEITLYKGKKLLTIDPDSKYKIRISKSFAKRLCFHLPVIKKHKAGLDTGINQARSLTIYGKYGTFTLTNYYITRLLLHEAQLIKFHMEDQ